MIILQTDEHGKANVTIKQDPTWEEIFANVKAAPGTEAEQRRHQDLRKRETLTEEEEEELNDLFFTIYPQLRLSSRPQMFHNEKGMAKNSTDAASSDTRARVNQTESTRKDKHMPRLDDDELGRMARLKQQVGRYHRNVANSPILCIGIGLIALFFGILCTTVDIATTEYLATGSLDKITGIQWGIWTQPWMLVTGQIPNLTQAVGFVYAWTVETVQLIFGLVLGHALTKVHSVSSRLARGFAVIGTILILLNGVATYNAAPVANPLMQFLIAIAMGGFSIVSFPIGIGLIETGMEEIF